MAADWYLPPALIKTCDFFFFLKGIDRNLKKEKAIKLKSEDREWQATADWLFALDEMRGEVNVEAFGVELVVSCGSSCQPLIISVCKEPVELLDGEESFHWINSASERSHNGPSENQETVGPSPFVWPSSQIECYPLGLQRVPLQP